MTSSCVFWYRAERSFIRGSVNVMFFSLSHTTRKKPVSGKHQQRSLVNNGILYRKLSFKRSTCMNLQINFIMGIIKKKERKRKGHHTKILLDHSVKCSDVIHISNFAIDLHGLGL